LRGQENNFGRQRDANREMGSSGTLEPAEWRIVSRAGRIEGQDNNFGRQRDADREMDSSGTLEPARAHEYRYSSANPESPLKIIY